MAQCNNHSDHYQPTEAERMDYEQDMRRHHDICARCKGLGSVVINTAHITQPPPQYQCIPCGTCGGTGHQPVGLDRFRDVVVRLRKRAERREAQVKVAYHQAATMVENAVREEEERLAREATLAELDRDFARGTEGHNG